MNTSHQTIAAKHRNANYTVQPTIVSNRKAIVVRLDWTDAKVVKTTVRKNFKLSVLAIDTKTWTPIQRSLMTLKAGQVIHFTQSSEHPGYYYITVVNESCTCTAGLYKQECHHQTDAVAFEARRQVATYRKDGVTYEVTVDHRGHFQTVPVVEVEECIAEVA